MSMDGLVLFNTYNTTGTNATLREGTSYLKYGCSHPDQGLHSEICDGYRTGKTTRQHNMEWEINGRSHIILCDLTESKTYNLVYGSDTVNKEIAIDPTHTYSIMIDSYGGTTTVTCPTCGYGKSFTGSYTVYVEAYGSNAAGIRTQPTSITVNCDEDGAFSISGVNIASYQWQICINGSWNSLSDGNFGNNGMVISGSRSDRLKIENLRTNLSGVKLRCVLTGMDYNNLNSNEATLTVNDNRPPAITNKQISPTTLTEMAALIIEANDIDSGLADNAYSFDGGITYQASNSKEFTENQTVNIAVRDAAGNVATDEYVIDNISEDAPEPVKVYLKGYVGKDGVAVRFL